MLPRVPASCSEGHASIHPPASRKAWLPRWNLSPGAQVWAGPGVSQRVTQLAGELLPGTPLTAPMFWGGRVHQVLGKLESAACSLSLFLLSPFLPLFPFCFKETASPQSSSPFSASLYHLDPHRVSACWQLWAPPVAVAVPCAWPCADPPFLLHHRGTRGRWASDSFLQRAGTGTKLALSFPCLKSSNSLNHLNAWCPPPFTGWSPNL